MKDFASSQMVVLVSVIILHRYYHFTHAFQALRTSGSTYVSSKNTDGSAVFYAEASNGNTAKLELMQAGYMVILLLRLVVLMR